MKYCEKCGNQLLDEAIMCPKCGCAVEKAPAKKQQGNTAKNLIVGSLLILSGIAIIILFAFLVMAQL